MLDAILDFLQNILGALFILFLIALLALFVYDKFIQRRHSLLISYPVIGRFRYFFEALREPMRQYFGEESFYESRDKVDWVYTASRDRANYKSFSVSQPFASSRFVIKHTEHVLNNDEVCDDFSVTFGKNRETPYTTSSPIFRSAMSDGALSPEAVRAFSIGAKRANFTLNTGEGGLTSNFLYTHAPTPSEYDYLEVVQPKTFAQLVFKVVALFSNRALSIKLYKKMMVDPKIANTYIFDPDSMILFRINWDAPLSAFPQEVPKDIPDLVLQIGSGLYGVRDSDGNFNKDRYEKAMRFCRMTEIKIAQGAKQTGGKLAANKVTADIAYYRGVEEGKDLISPNRFPFASTTEELLDFISSLQTISKKPVGVKIVISDMNNLNKISQLLVMRKNAGKTLPDFITVDGGDGGSATAPLELMESVGMTTVNALYMLDKTLRDHNIRDEIQIIASSKTLTPDDVMILLSLGADAVAIARGFMMSAGCIRARVCSGINGHHCPVGIATQDLNKRSAFLVIKQGKNVANYHNNLIKGMKTILAVMGVSKLSDVSKKNLTYVDRQGHIYFDIDQYFDNKLKY